MDFAKVGPELTVAAQCMKQLSWLTLVIGVLIIVLLATLLTGNSPVFWILVGSVLGAVLLYSLANSKQ
jgi:hypothetical protein